MGWNNEKQNKYSSVYRLTRFFFFFFFFLIDTCRVLRKGLPEKGPTKFHFSRDYWLFYTAISRKVVGENVRATIPKGDMGYDQYTVPDTVSSCRSYFCFFLLAPANIHPWPLVSFFQTSLKNSEFKTTHNTFRDCRVHFFLQPFSK